MVGRRGVGMERRLDAGRWNDGIASSSGRRDRPYLT